MTVCINRVSLQVFLIFHKVSARNPVFLEVFLISHKVSGRNPVFLEVFLVSHKVSTRNRVSLPILSFPATVSARNPVSKTIKPVWETVDSIVLLAHRHKLLLISEILARLDRLIVTQWEDLFHHNHRGYSYPVNRLN